MTKQENIVRVQRQSNGSWVEELPDGTFIPMRKGNTNWARVDAMTEEDIEYNALMDPDEEPFLTDADRAKIKTLPVPKTIRKKLGLTQAEFSRCYAIPLGTLRDWERGVRFADASARAYLRVISQDPEGVAKLLVAATEPSVRELVKV